MDAFKIGGRLRDDNPVLGGGIEMHTVGMGELLERVDFIIEVRVQEWESSRKRLGRRLAGVVGMHRPRPVRRCLRTLKSARRNSFSR